ncbi:MAG: roadblock/LC7 domain-containing protein [Candidatus Methanoperedens sp.]|nr:roadblock/LC7 domain-containing protein [Candidatus Methanoperedens sp.]
MATKAELYLNILQELEKCSDDILSTAIVTPDGLLICSTSSNGVERETFAAYSAATFRHAGNAMGEISNENIDTLIFESKNSRVVTMRSTDYALLIALTGKNAQMGMVLFEMQKTARKIKDL